MMSSSGFLQNGIESLSLRSDSQHKIIVGIDYGTTFSGKSFLLKLQFHGLDWSLTGQKWTVFNFTGTPTARQSVTPNKLRGPRGSGHIGRSYIKHSCPVLGMGGISYVTTDKSDIDDITILSAWPGEPGISWKTPTRIAYKRENAKIQSDKWGFEVHPKLISYSWTKLLLDKHAVAGEYDDPALSNMSGHGMLKLPRFRNAEEVCEDFLHELYKYMSSKLRQQMTASAYENTPMECWITLPAIWSEEAKDATLQAARRAGFGNRPKDEIFTIAEPEAAAIATLKRYSVPDALDPINPRDHILICDCGGGTVDITTYTITKVRPLLEFDELCIGVGGKCGSTYIDRNLHTLLSNRYGRAFDDIPWGQKGPGSKFMTCFEMVKRDFGLNDDREGVELSPLKLDISESEYYDEEESAVKLTYEDMRSLFDPVITEITNLVGQQVREAKERKNALIDRIVLVGGFGESHYLNTALAAWCFRNGNITLICPEHPQAAVVRGAALRGLEGIAPRMKQSRRHYGIILGLPFREGEDPEEAAYIDDFSDQKYCEGRMRWLISKGDEIFEDTFRTRYFTQKYRLGEPFRSEIILYSSALNEPPQFSTDHRVEEVGSIVSKFDKDFDYGPHAKSVYNARLGRMIYQFPFELQIRFGDKGNNLKFRNLVNGQIISTAVMEFNRD